jgi:hypothetical protein
MLKKAILIVVGVCCGSVQAFAETRGEEAIRLSKLTLSAIECSILAGDGNESQRLGEVGIAAGKKFLELIPKLNAEEQKSSKEHIAILWRGMSGYNSDFVMGRVWQGMVTITYRSLGDDTKQWERDKRTKYLDKNCMIIR